MANQTSSSSSSSSSSPMPIVFAGPSGVGKGTLINMLMKHYCEGQFGFSVSHTTRAPREGEVNGKHYHFTTVEDMKKEISEGKFVEYAEVHGRYYGTSVQSVKSVQEAGKVCILDIDVQGVQNVKKSNLQPHYIFVAPPSMGALEDRLRGRGTEKEEDIQTRLGNAQKELEYGQTEGNFDRVLVNDDLNKTFQQLLRVIQAWYPHLKVRSKPQPVVFAGPSGVGKGTLIAMLMERFPNKQFGFSVSHTTRKPRDGEIHGQHYFFTSVDEIKQDIADGKFIEYANVHGNYYGTSIAAVESVRDQGKICILDIDVQGVQKVKKSSLKPHYLFIAPPSMDALEKRLRGRGTESEEDIKKRLENAKAELDYGNTSGNFDRVFINADLSLTFEDLAEQFQEWYPHLDQVAPDDAPQTKNPICTSKQCTVS